MTNTITTNRPTLNDTLADIKRDHYLDMHGVEQIRIDVTRTVANIFGCHDRDVEPLCQISDLAANVRSGIEDEDLNTVLDDLQITESTFLADFVEWERF